MRETLSSEYKKERGCIEKMTMRKKKMVVEKRPRSAAADDEEYCWLCCSSAASLDRLSHHDHSDSLQRIHERMKQQQSLACSCSGSGGL